MYGDMTGSLVADGFDSSLISAMLARAPAGFHAVGFEIALTHRKEKDGELLRHEHVMLLVVDHSILHQPSRAGVTNYVLQNPDLPVFRRPTNLTLADLLRYVKRLEIKVQDKCTGRVPMRIVTTEDGD